ncbi:MAG: hypothetical protein CK527_03555 [Nitrosarchaeum sp.]|nr:hypothetical protein [Nitrosarchaeum sp.]PHY09014.1 MAG: hypothetical protein CK527_03555 [Nitrosarchaeum sp.]
MNIGNEFGMIHLLARCHYCDNLSLYCGKIPTSMRDMANKEVLFCKLCKFIIPIDKFKKILSSI